MKRLSAASSLIVAVLMAAGLVACSRTADAPPPASAPATPTSPPTPAAEAAPLSPELVARLVRLHSPVLGPAQAPVTVVEFLDPACEACRAFAPVVKQLLFMHPQDVRVVVRYAAFHEGSDEAVRILDAARRQGKFEEVLTALFDRQEEWAAHHAPDTGVAWKIAGEAGLDLARARRDARDPATDALLRNEAEDLIAIKVERTPTFFVNGKPLATFGVDPLLALVNAEVAQARGAATKAP